MAISLSFVFLALLASTFGQTNPNNPTYIANAQALTSLVSQLQNGKTDRQTDTSFS
jgi:hypothetical protein